jgi:tyrosyl-tRNA synthetase
LITLNWFRVFGYKPIVLFGGATGLIGDPSGRNSERNLMHADDINKNIDSFYK